MEEGGRDPEFEKVVGGGLGEPLLGTQQHDFISAIISRLNGNEEGYAKPLGKYDFITIVALAHTLGLTAFGNMLTAQHMVVTGNNVVDPDGDQGNRDKKEDSEDKTITDKT